MKLWSSLSSVTTAIERTMLEVHSFNPIDIAMIMPARMSIWQLVSRIPMDRILGDDTLDPHEYSRIQRNLRTNIVKDNQDSHPKWRST